MGPCKRPKEEITVFEILFMLGCLSVLPVLFWVLGLFMRVLGWTLRTVFSILGIFLFPLFILLGLAPIAVMFLLPLGVCWLAYSVFFAD